MEEDSSKSSSTEKKIVKGRGSLLDPLKQQFQSSPITAAYHLLAFVMLVITVVYTAWLNVAPRFIKPEILLVNNYCVRSTCRNGLSPTLLSPRPIESIENRIENNCSSPAFTQILEYALVNFSYVDIDNVEITIYINSNEFRTVDCHADGTDLEKQEFTYDENYSKAKEGSFKHGFVISPMGNKKIRSNQNHSIRLLHFQNDSNVKWRPDRILLMQNGVKLRDTKDGDDIQLTNPFSHQTVYNIGIKELVWLMVLLFIVILMIRHVFYTVPTIISQEKAKAMSAATLSVSSIPQQQGMENDLRKNQRDIDNLGK